ncbi:guanylate kinase, partial [Halorhodospira abdelmalekii]|uniref:guanylate kinase n=1 Tax=Halorhodospira abdelmalekii TaxID=421629 RepID=UPI001904E5E8
PSGAGKTTLVRALLEREPGVELSVSHTTRAQRPGEIDGVHYHFVSAAQFTEALAADRFIEHAQVFGNLYGTSRDAVEARLEAGADIVLEIDWQGAQQVRKLLPEAVTIFILPPSRRALAERLQARAQDAPEVIERRMAEAEAEIAHYREYDYLIVNDDFTEALEQLRLVVCSQRLSQRRQEPRLRRLLSGLLSSGS